MDFAEWLQEKEASERSKLKKGLESSIKTSLKGGKGSGNWGHAGRPGKIGGSMPSHGGQRIERVEAKFDEVTVHTGVNNYVRKHPGQFKYPRGEEIRQRLLANKDIKEDVGESKIKRIEEINRQAHENYKRALLTLDDQDTEGWVAFRDGQKALRDEAQKLHDEILATEKRNGDLMAEMLKSDDPLKSKVTVSAHWKDIHQPDEKEKAEIIEAIDRVKGCIEAGDKNKREWIDGKYPENIRVWTINLGGASYYRDETNRIYIGWESDAPGPSQGSVATHEFGHWLEHNKPVVGEAAEAFLEARLVRTQLETRYNPIERTRGGWEYFQDRFIDSYMGRIYPKQFNTDGEYFGPRATEIVSSALEMMFTNPKKLANGDPEMFDFTVWALSNDPISIPHNEED